MVIKLVCIPAAGSGSRMIPLTILVPKEGIPVLQKVNGRFDYDFLINHVLKSCKNVGIEDALIITDVNKGTNLMKIVSNTGPRMNHVEYVVQDMSAGRGLGKAVEAAKHGASHYGDQFAVWLGDNLFDNTSIINSMVNSDDDNLAEILVIETERLSHYGIVNFKSLSQGTGYIKQIIEKPTKDELSALGIKPPFYGVAGFYTFSKRIFDYLSRIKPGRGGEYQLTDAIKLGLDEGESVRGWIFSGERFDYGSWDDLIKLQSELFSKLYNDPKGLKGLITKQKGIMSKFRGD